MEKERKMSRILVTTSQLRDLGKSFDRTVHQIEGLEKKLKSSIDQLHLEYKYKNELYQKFNEAKSKSIKVSDNLSQMANHLREAADRFEKADSLTGEVYSSKSSIQELGGKMIAGTIIQSAINGFKAVKSRTGIQQIKQVFKSGLREGVFEAIKSTDSFKIAKLLSTTTVSLDVLKVNGINFNIKERTGKSDLVKFKINDWLKGDTGPRWLRNTEKVIKKNVSEQFSFEKFIKKEMLGVDVSVSPQTGFKPYKLARHVGKKAFQDIPGLGLALDTLDVWGNFKDERKISAREISEGSKVTAAEKFSGDVAANASNLIAKTGGSAGGAYIGAAIGTALLPGPGTVILGIAGGMVGDKIADGLTGKNMETGKETVGYRFMEKMGEKVPSGIKSVKKAMKKYIPFF